MDKRWLLIIIIFIIGISSMYYIVDNSNTVGSAITTFSKTTITIPKNFSVGDTGASFVELYNKQNSEKITIYDNGKGNTAVDDLKNITAAYQETTDYINITNKTEKIANQTVYSAYLVDENGTDQISTFYRQKHTYTLVIEDFKNTDDINTNLKFIITTMTPDYKQAQD